ncbi:MAG: pyridoxamine 5'-phosphate oxidase family protein [Acidobacteria bacterium]|nr:pyridoxamine 5'-phosphate oxidase family protein [Acidobacteriota bacterium]
MVTTKRASKKKQPGLESGPKASRPHIPGYGIPNDKKGLLPWEHVTDRMSQAMHYWICTVSPDGRPHATPVDGLWLDDQLYFGGSPQTRRNRNLAANPAVCVHLENGLDVVILHGDAKELRAPDLSLATRLSEESARKYGYGPKPEEFGAGGVYVFRPRMVLAWKQFPKDATRWHLEE